MGPLGASVCFAACRVAAGRDAGGRDAVALLENLTFGAIAWLYVTNFSTIVD